MYISDAARRICHLHAFIDSLFHYLAVTKIMPPHLSILPLQLLVKSIQFTCLHGLSEFTWTIRVYMDYQSLHGLSQFTWTIRVYMDYHSLHGLSQFTWTIRVYMDYQSLHGLSELKACLLVVIADGSCVRVRS